MHFAQQGRTFIPHDNTKTNIHAALPPGVYVMKADMKIGLFVEQVDNFTMPTKLYGTVADDSTRVLNTFRDRSGATGLLLSGDSGSGKTLLAKQIAIDAQAAGMPVILVNDGYAGDAFSDFVQGMHQEAVFLFDEFEKTHKPEAQQGMLTLLDGVMGSKKLFILTINDLGKMSEFLTNRPGRLYYHFVYDGLTLEFVREYALDVLVNKDNVEGVVAAAIVAGKFSFDQLSALCAEMNRYQENASQATKRLNISTRGIRTYCKVSARSDTGVELIQASRFVDQTGDPLAGDGFQVDLSLDVPITDEASLKILRSRGDDSTVTRMRLFSTTVDSEDLRTFDLMSGLFEYEIDCDPEMSHVSTPALAKMLGKDCKVIKVTVQREKPFRVRTLSELLAGIQK